LGVLAAAGFAVPAFGAFGFLYFENMWLVPKLGLRSLQTG
jgi:hypothetical protein